MANLILLNKPFNVLCQFTDKEGRPTLADYVHVGEVYPAGRLDYDSEGLVLLTDDGALQHRIASPTLKMAKTYWAQVDGDITEHALEQLRKGIQLKDGPTRPAQARRIHEPGIWDRQPPVRYRANVPTSWIELTLTEGRNRQVRRMTAAVGFPTLRLIRTSIGDWHIDGLRPGETRQLEVHLPNASASRFGHASGRRPKGAQQRRNR